MNDYGLLILALFLIALLQGYNWSRIERMEAEYALLKKALEAKGIITNGR